MSLDFDNGDDKLDIFILIRSWKHYISYKYIIFVKLQLCIQTVQGL